MSSEHDNINLNKNLDNKSHRMISRILNTKLINQLYYLLEKATINKQTRLVLTVKNITKIHNSRLGIRETKTL